MITNFYQVHSLLSESPPLFSQAKRLHLLILLGWEMHCEAPPASPKHQQQQLISRAPLNATYRDSSLWGQEGG